MTPLTGLSPLATAGNAPQAGRNFDQLSQRDFVRLLTVQMQQQDPFEPLNNEDMVAQMAQFSSLSGIENMNATLQQISTKLDVLAAAQGVEAPTSSEQDSSQEK